MDEPSCRECSRPVEPRFRFCPWCAAPLRLKAVEFFRAVEACDGDGDALRVSVYRPGHGVEPQVRVSVWRADGEATAALSLSEAEAARMASFVLRAAAPSPEPTADTIP
jgi:hypothetical protein